MSATTRSTAEPKGHYVEKLEALFAAMKDQHYSEFFKGDVAKAVKTLQLRLDTMSSYIDRVYEHESLERRIEQEGGADLRDELESANGRRTAAHNAAMSGLNVVNRVFAGYGLEPFIEVPEEWDRSQIGEAIAGFVGETFLGQDEPVTRSQAAVIAHDTGLTHEKRSEQVAELLQRLSAE